MSSEASHHVENLGKVLAYTVYNIGVGIIIGLVRTVISVAYIAKHTFYSKAYEEAHNKKTNERLDKHIDKQIGRDREVRDAEKKTKEATGLSKVGAWFSEKTIKVKHAFGEKKDNVVFEVQDTIHEVKNVAVQSTETARREEWYGQLVRGLSEIVYFGSYYYTYQDNFSKDHKASVFGIRE